MSADISDDAVIRWAQGLSNADLSSINGLGPVGCRWLRRTIVHDEKGQPRKLDNRKAAA